MKKILTISMVIGLMLPTVVLAGTSVLQGVEYVKKSYELEGGNWERVRNFELKVFFVIDADPGTPSFTTNHVELFLFWKEKEGGETFKYYERINLLDMGANLQVHDLGGDGKVGITVSLEFTDGGEDSFVIGNLFGEKNNKGLIKWLKGLLFSHDSLGGQVVEFEKIKWDLERTMEFDDESLSAEEIANNIESYLQGKGFVPEIM